MLSYDVIRGFSRLHGIAKLGETIHSCHLHQSLKQLLKFYSATTKSGMLVQHCWTLQDPVRPKIACLQELVY